MGNLLAIKAAHHYCGNTCSGSLATLRFTLQSCRPWDCVRQLVSVFSRKPIFGYKAMVYAMLSIGIMGFMVWAITCS